MKHVVLFIMISFLLSSCTTSLRTGREEVIISLKDISKEVELTDLYEDFELVRLETKDESLFQRMNKLICHNDKYYILDKVLNKKVFVFEKDGTYSHKIGAVGRGRGEYINMEDFTIDEENNRIVILAYPSTVYVYDMNGIFQFSKQLSETMIWNIMSYEQGFVASTNHMTYTEGEHAFQLYFFDKNFKFQRKKLPVLPEQVQVPPFIASPLQKSGKEIVYFDSYTPELHIIETTDSFCINTYKFDMKSPVPCEVFSDQNLFFNDQGKYDFFMEALYANNTLHAYFTSQGIMNVLIAELDINNNSTNIYKFKSWFPKLLYHKNGVFYSTVSAEQIIENHENFFAPLLTDSVKSGDNNFILKFKCKSN